MTFPRATLEHSVHVCARSEELALEVLAATAHRSLGLGVTYALGPLTA